MSVLVVRRYRLEPSWSSCEYEAMLCLAGSITSKYLRVSAFALLIALICGLVSSDGAELASTHPLPWESGLSTLGNMQSRPRDTWTQMYCQNTTVCPDCTAVERSVVETVLSGQCSPLPGETPEEVYCNGHRLLKATVVQLQQEQCFDICTSEAAAFCSQPIRKLLQSGRLRHQS